MRLPYPSDAPLAENAASLPLHDPVALALAEDIGDGDLTALYFIEAEARASARIFTKETCVLAGVSSAARAFALQDSELTVRELRADGDRLYPGDTVLEIIGATRSIVTAERTALNFLQRLSGIATLTRKYVDAVQGSSARILDTRKTTPCLRHLEKAAVKAGGGHNHRFGLYDMVMVKDNHLLADDSNHALRDAICHLKSEKPGVSVELEADTLDQVRRFLEIEGVDVILLDNMSCEEMREAVRMGAGRVFFEASGGVTLERVPLIAATGVDFISIGALTHSATAIDFSLELLV